MRGTFAVVMEGERGSGGGNSQRVLKRKQPEIFLKKNLQKDVIQNAKTLSVCQHMTNYNTIFSKRAPYRDRSGGATLRPPSRPGRRNTAGLRVSSVLVNVKNLQKNCWRSEKVLAK